MHVTTAELTAWIATVLWPFVRIGAMFLAAPIFSARMVPIRVRLLLTLALAAVLAPSMPEVPQVEPLSFAGLTITLQQVLIGVTMGFILQMVLATLAIAGESVALSMGLGFATQIDPANGIQVPVVSSYYVTIGTLLFLALNGHLALISVIAKSFETLPVGLAGIDRAGIWQVASWAGQMFAGAVLVALPAVASLLLVNLSFAVVTRAAPQLNIFAVGFPVTLSLGLIVILLSTPGLTPHVARLMNEGYALMTNLTAG